jgi:hypothetical protein
MMMDFILGNQVPDDTQAALADMNGDGSLNVLDVVMMVDIVLGGGLARGTTAQEASFYYGNDFVSYKSDGNIAGIQFEVTGEYVITDNFLPDGWELEHNETTIILFSMDGSALEDDKLFSYDGDIAIESIIAAEWYDSANAFGTIMLEVEIPLPYQSAAIMDSIAISPSYENSLSSSKAEPSILNRMIVVSLCSNSQPSGRKLSVITYSPVTSNWIPAILPSDL